jgi:predicted metal-dependent hydrolase
VQLHLPFASVPEPKPIPELQRQPIPQPFSVSEVHFVRVRRARRYILRVQPDGSLRVTVPRGGSRREAEAFVRENRRWIEGERRRVSVQHAPPEWSDGTEIMFRGHLVTLTIDEARGVVRYGNRSVPFDVSKPLRTLVENDLRDIARNELVPLLQELAARNGLNVSRVSIRNQRSRWGSCARRGHIALNFRLVQMPEHVRDYVLVHELMHLRQQNHSRRFWRLVEAAYPAFRDAERWLRTEGRSLF